MEKHFNETVFSASEFLITKKAIYYVSVREHISVKSFES